MSFKNPNISELIPNSTGELTANDISRKDICSAMNQIAFKTGSRPTLEHAQIIRDLVETNVFEQEKYYRESAREDKIKSAFYSFCCHSSMKVDVKLSVSRFMDEKVPEDKRRIGVDPGKSFINLTKYYLT